MNKILYSKRGVLLAVFVAASTHCKEVAQPAVAVAQPKPKEVIAHLNGTPIFRTDLEEYFSLTAEGNEEGIGESESARVFQEFIVQMILWQDALKVGTQVSETGAGITADPSQQSPTAQKWEEIFSTIQGYLNSELDVGSKIRLSDLFKYYSQHQNEFEVGDRRRVLEIVASTRSQAEVIRSQLEYGDFRAFRAMAAKHSIGQHKDGELGVVERGQLPPTFEKLIFSLRTGEISPILPSQLGHHIFCVEEQTPRHFQKFYEVQESIFHRLLVEEERQALHQLVEERIAQADIRILDPRLQSFWRKRDADLG